MWKRGMRKHLFPTCQRPQSIKSMSCIREIERGGKSAYEKLFSARSSRVEIDYALESSPAGVFSGGFDFGLLLYSLMEGLCVHMSHKYLLASPVGWQYICRSNKVRKLFVSRHHQARKVLLLLYISRTRSTFVLIQFRLSSNNVFLSTIFQRDKRKVDTNSVEKRLFLPAPQGKSRKNLLQLLERNRLFDSDCLFKWIKRRQQVLQREAKENRRKARDVLSSTLHLNPI